jgi:hypothetical protein
MEPHQIVFSWTDEECLTFEGIAASVVVPILNGTTALADVQPVGGGPCFVCGCPEAAHEEIDDDGATMCSKHQCREYVP